MADRRETLNRDLLERIAEDFTNDRDVAMEAMFRNPTTTKELPLPSLCAVIDQTTGIPIAL